MNLFQRLCDGNTIREEWCGTRRRVFCRGDEFETGAVCFGGIVYFVGDGDKETRVDISFGGDAYCCRDVGFYGEWGVCICRESEVDAGMGGSSSVTGVVKVLNEGGERVEFGRCGVPFMSITC
jgi:hypothetical protein